MRKSLTLTTVFAALLAATPALAHTGVGPTSGLAAGLMHPLMGLDHLLAMLSVGIWSSLVLGRQGRKNHVWLPPLAFMGAMLAGAGLAFAGVALPGVETGIAVSVMLLGLMIATQARLGLGLALGVIAAFAILHGHAHGTEAAGALTAYMAGFTLATGALHLTGLGIGNVMANKRFAAAALGLAFVAAGVQMAAM